MCSCLAQDDFGSEEEDEFGEEGEDGGSDYEAKRGKKGKKVKPEKPAKKTPKRKRPAGKVNLQPCYCVSGHTLPVLTQKE